MKWKEVIILSIALIVVAIAIGITTYYYDGLIEVLK